MAAFETIVAKLAEVFAEMDAKTEVDAREWGLRTRDRIKAVRDELRENRRKMGEWAYYERVYAAANGKVWFRALDGLDDVCVIATMDQNTAATVAKRNATIVAKLMKAGITEVIESTFARSKDGFDGKFVVNTDQGRKAVTINSIYAGGYNIQCFHMRVLVKIK
jgi:hypothetical protein